MTNCTYAEKIERWTLDRLVPYARNPRTHAPEQVAQIASSIRAFGFNNPVLVDAQGGVIAGHGRLLAARQLGLMEVPVLVLDHLSEVQKRAYVIADNKLALNAGWDEELLALEMQDLKLSEFDLELTGFDSAEIDRLLAELDPAGSTGQEDLAPDPPAEPVTRSGDLWLLGRHRLLCGDATDQASIERVLDGALADMVFTDPPYNVSYGSTPRRQGERRAAPMHNDSLGADFPQFLRSACTNMLTVTKGALYICMASAELHTLHRAFVGAGGHWSTFIVWAKNHFTLGRADYQRQYEPILYGWREGTDHYWCGARDQGDIWFIDRPQANDLHPTMKPVALMQRAIRNSSKSRDIVLDPFAGSGSTGIACEASDRMARMIEIDPAYCDVIVQRWGDYTGDEALLEPDGMSLEEAREARHATGA